MSLIKRLLGKAEPAAPAGPPAIQNDGAAAIAVAIEKLAEAAKELKDAKTAPLPATDAQAAEKMAAAADAMVVVARSIEASQERMSKDINGLTEAVQASARVNAKDIVARQRTAAKRFAEMLREAEERGRAEARRS